VNCKVGSFFDETSTVRGLQMKCLLESAVPVTRMLEIHRTGTGTEQVWNFKTEQVCNKPLLTKSLTSGTLIF